MQTKIKIADLLKESGQQDTVTFDTVQLEGEGITDKGISGKVTLTSFNQDTVEATFHEISCERMTDCDRCGKTFCRSIRNDFHEVIFTSNPSAYAEEDADEIFEIDTKGNIDLAPALHQAIGLVQPISILCYDCITDDHEESDDEELRGGGSIDFSYE